MAITRIPAHTTLADGQFIRVEGPNSITSSYSYDTQQRALYYKESQVVFPSFHGPSHIAEDPVPSATCDTSGLMSADDKCKLDALLQTRIGVLGFQGAGFCVLPECRVMTVDGTCKPISKIAVGDVVVGGSGKPRVVEHVYSRHVDEEIYSVNCRSHQPGGLKLTRGHKVLAVKRADMECVRPDGKARKGNPCRHNSRNCSGCTYEGVARTTPRWIPVETLEVGDFVVNRKAPSAIANTKSIKISDYIQCKVRNGITWPTEYYTKTTNTSSGLNYSEPQLHINATGCSMPDELTITDDLLRLLGYFLSEGSATTKRFSFALHRNELDDTVGKDICDICYRLFGINPTIIYDREDKHRDSNGVQLLFNHSLMAKLLKALCGGTAKTKRIPRFIMELPPYKQRQLLLAFMRGDGSSTNTYKSKRIKTQLCNQELVEQIGALLARNNCRPAYESTRKKLDSWDKKSVRTSYAVSGATSEAPWLYDDLGRHTTIKQRDFTLHVDQGDYQFDEIRSIKLEPYCGLVYDITIPDEHSYVVNGIVVHNSDDGGWLQGDIILAAGTEFISLERIGNVVRFTVDSPIPLNCTCFTAGAPVLMADGTTKGIANIVIGDEVVTHNRKIKKVSHTFVNEHDGLVYNFKVEGHRSNEAWATGNHPYLAIRSENLTCVRESKSICRHNSWRCDGCEYENIDRTQPEWIEAKDLKVGDFLVSVFGPNDVVDTKEIVLSEWVDNLVEAEDKVILTFTNHAGNSQYSSSTKLPSSIPITSDILFFFGAYLAEGHTRNDNLAIFSIHVDELQDGELGSEIIRIGKESFGIRPIVCPIGDNSVQIIFCSSILARLLNSLFGNGVADKQIPQFLMQLHPQDHKSLLLGLFQGDGHRHKKQNRITLQLANKQLINQVACILQRQGHNPSVSGVHSGTTNAGTIYSAWTVTVQSSDAKWLDQGMGFGGVSKTISREVRVGQHILHRITDIDTQTHTGNVYNFEVEDEHTYVVNQLAVHNCESCTQIYWIQDETDIASIRPPSCGGKFPGVNAYGEIKVYLFPESTIADPTNVAATLNNKGNYPAFIFKRYDDAIVPGSAELEAILKRDSTNRLQTEIGWAMTPGASGMVECVWFTGKDADGNQTRFDLAMEPNASMLGSILYKGHLITKKKAVIIDYTSSILSTNNYTCREWNLDRNAAIGDPFTARNVWQYNNPENPETGNNAQSLVLDASIDLLPIGTLVDLWWFKVGEVAGEPIRRYFFSNKPTINANHIWTWVGQTQFGDVDIAREELQPNDGSNDKFSAEQVSSIRQFSHDLWGITGYDDPLLSFDVASTAGTEAADISVQHRAVVDTNLPGLKVIASTEALTDFSERPVYLWNRKNICNAKVRLDVGRPNNSLFTPYDILLRAPIDETTTKFLRIVGKGILSDGSHYIKVCGCDFHDLPPFGAIRTLHPYANINNIYNYRRKLMFPSSYLDKQGTWNGTAVTEGMTDPAEMLTACDTISLVSTDNLPYLGQVGDIVELLHQEYSAPILRVEFAYNESTQVIDVQFKVGMLDMSRPYEEDVLGDDVDDFVRGLAPGYAVSGVYSQAGTYSGVGTQPDSNPEDFIVYDGGAVIGGTLPEYWNKLEVMIRDNQVWIWWNNLLIPPSTVLSAGLPTPVDIATPYFPIEYDSNRPFGKVGARLWPGASVRRFDIKTQISIFSEFSYGQLSIT